MLSVQFLEAAFLLAFALVVYSCIQKTVVIAIVLCVFLWICLRIIRKGNEEHVPCHGKFVLITGCDKGMGFHLAKRLYTLGYDVFATCLDTKSDGATDLQNYGGQRIHVLPLDVTSDKSVSECVKSVERICGEKPLWAIVNNAGIMSFGDVELLTIGMYRDVLDINLFGIIRVTKAFLPLIRRAKGRVVNVTSVRGLLAFPGNSNYVISKFGAEAFSDCLRMEMKRFGVKVVIVEPGNFGRASSICDEANEKRMLKLNAEMMSAASKEVIETYGSRYMDIIHDAVFKGTSTSHLTLEPVMEALSSAVASVSPKHRYLVDGSNELYDVDCMMARLRPFVPVSFLDYLLLKYRGPPPEALLK